MLLAAQATLFLTAGGAEAGTAAQASVTVNGATRYQRVIGFGASEAFKQAETVMNATSAVRRQVLRLLYSPTEGAGLTILRNEISDEPGITIEPNAPPT